MPDKMIDNSQKRRLKAGRDGTKREQIVDGARRVFIELGFDAASMNDIRQAAGVSKGTLYVYFASKQELFEALVEDDPDATFQNMYNVLDSSADLRGTLISLGVMLATRMTSAKVIMAQRMIISVSGRIRNLGARFYKRGPKRGHEWLVAFLTDAVDKGLLAINDIDLAAHQYHDLCMAGLHHECIFAYRQEQPSSAEIERVVISGVDMFLKSYATVQLQTHRVKGK